MELDSGCGAFGGDVLLADWERTGVDSLRADLCVPAIHGRAGPVGLELSSAVVLEVCRLGVALVTLGAEDAPGEWRFVLQSFTLEWHGLPPMIPALGAIWCELLVETSVGEPAPGERPHTTWSCTLVAGGRPIVAGRIDGRLLPTRAAPDPGDVSPESLADTVLSAIRLRAPNGQVNLVEMSFGDRADRDAPLELDLSWDPATEVNVFSIRQGERSIATARIGLVGRESLTREWAVVARGAAR
ncbi:hypothetical protein [Agromyces silvae]|uniref:hypothetical protein n=1 Tax=Agromyces silvae TaxID=3388266 RepID=UPI00280B0F58|nr:hypothetical protein [Agromyces protaetiae]